MTDTKKIIWFAAGIVALALIGGYIGAKLALKSGGLPPVGGPAPLSSSTRSASAPSPTANQKVAPPAKPTPTSIR